MARAAPHIETLASIGESGARNFLHPATATGRYTTRRTLISTVLVALLVVLPFVSINGFPAVWLDVAHGHFHLFGRTLAPTDSVLLFFVLSGVGFALIVTSGVWGRVWCGYACPQTIFLESVYRRIERLVEGSREQQIRLDKAPWSAAKVARKTAKFGLFFIVSALLAHLVSAYFIGAHPLWLMMLQGPRSAPLIFAWLSAATGIIFFNFAWFREQLCIIICPYGRLQSALSDRDTVVIGYDSTRGEPRGALKEANKGDCIDCLRCVAVCPTGIDIRHGLQLECVGCASCVDACDEVMVRIGRKPGLVRYDTERGFAGETRRFWRPRIALYAALTLLGCAALGFSWSQHQSMPVTLLHLPGAPYTITGEQIENGYLLKLRNKGFAPVDVEISVQTVAGAQVILPMNHVLLAPTADASVPFFVRLSRGAFTRPFAVTATVTEPTQAHTDVVAEFMGPRR